MCCIVSNSSHVVHLSFCFIFHLLRFTLVATILCIILYCRRRSLLSLVDISAIMRYGDTSIPRILFQCDIPQASAFLPLTMHCLTILLGAFAIISTLSGSVSEFSLAWAHMLCWMFCNLFFHFFGDCIYNYIPI